MLQTILSSFSVFFMPPHPLPMRITMANWTRSNMKLRELQELIEGNLLFPLTTTKEWKLSEFKEEPASPLGYVVSFTLFHKRGLDILGSDFFRVLLFHF